MNWIRDEYLTTNNGIPSYRTIDEPHECVCVCRHTYENVQCSLFLSFNSSILRRRSRRKKEAGKVARISCRILLFRIFHWRILKCIRIGIMRRFSSSDMTTKNRVERCITCAGHTHFTLPSTAHSIRHRTTLVIETINEIIERQKWKQKAKKIKTIAPSLRSISYNYMCSTMDKMAWYSIVCNSTSVLRSSQRRRCRRFNWMQLLQSKNKNNDNDDDDKKNWKCNAPIPINYNNIYFLHSTTTNGRTNEWKCYANYIQWECELHFDIKIIKSICNLYQNQWIDVDHRFWLFPSSSSSSFVSFYFYSDFTNYSSDCVACSRHTHTTFSSLHCLINIIVSVLIVDVSTESITTKATTEEKKNPYTNTSYWSASCVTL